MEFDPEQLAIRRREMAVEYNKKMKELAEIKKNKALKIIELIGQYKTVSRAEIAWEATVEGQKEIELTFYLRGLLELMRSVKTEIEMKSAEAWGKY